MKRNLTIAAAVGIFAVICAAYRFGHSAGFEAGKASDFDLVEAAQRSAIADFIQDAANARTKKDWSQEDIAALRALTEGRTVIANADCELINAKVGKMTCRSLIPGTIPMLITGNDFTVPSAPSESKMTLLPVTKP